MQSFSKKKAYFLTFFIEEVSSEKARKKEIFSAFFHVIS